MNEVKIKKENLLSAVRANRTTHRDEFIEAQAGFRTRVIEELDRRLQDARDGKKVNLMISMPEPQDHTEDYDRVIRMLEMSVDEEVKLSASEFDQYVMDNWQWARAAKLVNASYTAAR
jgi:hypothetical protein